MNEEVFISIMESCGITDKAIVCNAYKATQRVLEFERQQKKGCEERLIRQINKEVKSILNFSVSFDVPFFLYKDFLEKKNKGTSDLCLCQFVEHINVYASLFESKLMGWAHVKIVDNDILVIPTGSYRKIKRMLGIASDVISNCIYSDIQYDPETGRFTAIVNIVDGDFFARNGIDYYFREPDSRKAIFTGVLKREKIKFDLKINREEIVTELEIHRKKDDDRSIGQILKDSIIQANRKLAK